MKWFVEYMRREGRKWTTGSEGAGKKREAGESQRQSMPSQYPPSLFVLIKKRIRAVQERVNRTRGNPLTHVWNELSSSLMRVELKSS